MSVGLVGIHRILSPGNVGNYWTVSGEGLIGWYSKDVAGNMLEIIGRYWERDSLGCGAANPSWGVTKVD